jgi:hypothetical protein
MALRRLVSDRAGDLSTFPDEREREKPAWKRPNLSWTGTYARSARWASIMH